MYGTLAIPQFSYQNRGDKNLLMTVDANSPLEIARGNVPGATPFGAHGKMVEPDAINNKIIWPNGDFTIPDQTTGETISFVSGSAQDSASGTGVRTVRVLYIDINLQSQYTDITLTGTTPVTGQLSGCRFIQCMYALTTGTGNAAAGEITAYRSTDSAVDFAQISAGETRCQSSARMVPAGKCCFLAGSAASSSSGLLGADVLIDIVSTYFNGENYAAAGQWYDYGSIGTQDNSVAYTFPVPLCFPEGAIIAMRATKGTVDATIIGDWFGWLEDAD